MITTVLDTFLEHKMGMGGLVGGQGDERAVLRIASNNQKLKFITLKKTNILLLIATNLCFDLYFKDQKETF